MPSFPIFLMLLNMHFWKISLLSALSVFPLHFFLPSHQVCGSLCISCFHPAALRSAVPAAPQDRSPQLSAEEEEAEGSFQRSAGLGIWESHCFTVRLNGRPFFSPALNSLLEACLSTVPQFSSWSIIVNFPLLRTHTLFFCYSNYHNLLCPAVTCAS